MLHLPQGQARRQRDFCLPKGISGSIGSLLNRIRSQLKPDTSQQTSRTGTGGWWGSGKRLRWEEGRHQSSPHMGLFVHLQYSPDEGCNLHPRGASLVDTGLAQPMPSPCSKAALHRNVAGTGGSCCGSPSPSLLGCSLCGTGGHHQHGGTGSHVCEPTSGPGLGPGLAGCMSLAVQGKLHHVWLFTCVCCARVCAHSYWSMAAWPAAPHGTHVPWSILACCTHVLAPLATAGWLLVSLVTLWAALWGSEQWRGPGTAGAWCLRTATGPCFALSSCFMEPGVPPWLAAVSTGLGSAALQQHQGLHDLSEHRDGNSPPQVLTPLPIHQRCMQGLHRCTCSTQCLKPAAWQCPVVLGAFQIQQH